MSPLEGVTRLKLIFVAEFREKKTLNTGRRGKMEVVGRRQLKRSSFSRGDDKKRASVYFKKK